MREPGTTEEFVAFLEECDFHTRSGSDLGLRRALRASGYLKQIGASRYLTRNLRMRLAGVLGDGLAAANRSEEAERVFAEARARSASQTERASLAIRLARFYSENGRWNDAVSEAELAVQHFCKQRPKHETDLRSPTGALVARGNVYFLAMVAEKSLPRIANLLSRAERDYREALRFASRRTEFSAIAALTNLSCLALRSWWTLSKREISPSSIATEMKKICRLLRKRGVKYHSRVHAKARWLYGLSSVEAYGSLNRSNENRLERALADLLDEGAINDAAILALDLGFCYLRENRLDDLLTVTSTVLHHPYAKKLLPEWRHALIAWEKSIEQRHTAVVVSETFKVIRGFSVVWQAPKEIRVPKYRFGDRSDTLGF